MKKALIILAFALPAYAALPPLADKHTDEVPIPATEQNIGDAAKGYDYLTTGNFLRSGIPYNAFILVNGKDKTNLLNRTGKNATVMQGYNVVKNGDIDVVIPTCLQCHSQQFNGKLILGLGNSTLDFTSTKSVNFGLNRAILKMLTQGKYRAARDFVKSFETTFPLMQTEVRGVNTANKLAMILVAHRDPQTLTWSDTALMNIPDEVYPVDVPAWWHMKKKNAMFYNGFARGDQASFLMLANLLTVKDTTEAREVKQHFADVLAYIKSIEPPKYPYAIDKSKADRGQLVFNSNCSRCHGTYGDNGSYPNLLIASDIIQTDTTLSAGIRHNTQFIDWFNRSWFARDAMPAQLVPFDGYIAPPLDGIWITAPYLHNGSVPTLEALLNSKLRPRYWSRDFKHLRYDYKAVGWKYTVETTPKRKKVYNTTLTGYYNGGHYFGDALTDEERQDVIEYLKTL